MKKEKLKSYVELYICIHHRDDRESCAGKGSKELSDKLKKWSKEEHGKEIKIVRSSCLGKCSEGIAMACYPQRKFILDVKPDDYKEIKEGLEKALKEAKD